MNKLLLYLLLFSYTTVIVKPVLPTISDTIAHIFWYSQHMATVHYEHGQYHVHIEYADAAKKGYPEKNNTQKEDDSVNFHLSSEYSHTFAAYFFAENRFILYSSALADMYISSNYPPPKIA